MHRNCVWKAGASDHFKAGRQNTTADQRNQAFSGPLIHHNSRWLHYTRSSIALSSITSSRTLSTTSEHRRIFNEPIGSNCRSMTETRHEAIEMKLAWKFLTDADMRSNRFLMCGPLPVVEYVLASTEAPAHKSGNASDNPGPGQSQTLGLGGMHFAMRTRSPQWIWGTFEQIDGTHLDFASGDGRDLLAAHPSLASPDGRGALGGVNALPAYNATAVGCHYSAGVCIDFRRDSARKLLPDASRNKIPIFGKKANGSVTANFSWMRQIKAQAWNTKQ